MASGDLVIREQILRALEARLATIPGVTVDALRVDPAETADALPLLELVDRGHQRVSDNFSSGTEFDLAVDILGTAAGQPGARDARGAAHDLYASAWAALAAEPRHWGGLILFASETGFDMEPVAAESRVATFRLSLSIRYRTAFAYRT